MKQRGFTLIEVMIALAIFAVSAMAVLSATGETITTLGNLKQKTFAAMVADNQLALMKLEGVPNAEKSGSSNLAGETWYWTIKPTPTADGTLRAVDLIVWQNESKRSSLVTVRTYVTQ